MLNDKLFNPRVLELCIRGRKLNIYLIFITKSYFHVLKNNRLNSKHYFIKKIANKLERQQIALNDTSDTDFKSLMDYIIF